MLLPVDPFPVCCSRSSTITFVQPCSARCQAIDDPTMPAPMITTSAVSPMGVYCARSAVLFVEILLARVPAPLPPACRNG